MECGRAAPLLVIAFLSLTWIRERRSSSSWQRRVHRSFS